MTTKDEAVRIVDGPATFPRQPRDVQGELIGDVLNPGNWSALLFGGDNRSDLAARYYDRIFFHGATYADLQRSNGPLVIASATEFSSGSRFAFTQGNFDLLEAIQVREDVRRQLGLGRVRRVALIVVNALSSSSPQWGRSPIGPGILDAILQATSVPIDRNSMDPILLMQAMIERWKLQGEIRALEAHLDHEAPPTTSIEFFSIVIDFDAIPEAAERNFFNALPTTFALVQESMIAGVTVSVASTSSTAASGLSPLL